MNTKGKGITMTQARIRILYELLVTQMNHLIFYPFALAIPVLSESLYAVQHPSLLVWIIGGLIPFGYYFCRKYIKRYFLLQVLHYTGVGLRVLLAFWLTPKFHIFLFIYYILVGIGFAFNSVDIKINAKGPKGTSFEDRAISVAPAVAFIAASVLLPYYICDSRGNIYYKITVILILAFYFLSYYIREYLDFLAADAVNTGILPAKEVFRAGMKQTCVCTAGLAIIMWVSRFGLLETLLLWIRYLVLLLWKTFLSFLGSDLQKTAEPSESKLVLPGHVGTFDYISGTDEPSLFWTTLEDIALAIVFLGILAVLFLWIRRTILYINKMMKKQAPEDPETTGAVEIREKCGVNKKSRRSNKTPLAFPISDARERIRFLYKKTALAKIPAPGSDRLHFYTARELEQEMAAAPFADLYEKARYSDKPCTLKDVKSMKDACRGHKE